MAAALATAACSGDDDATPTTSPATTTSTVPSPSTSTTSTTSSTGDGSPFCAAMLGIGQIGGDAESAPEQVLADNQALAALLDEAQANTPEDSPPDLDALIDDYRAASQAIVDAGGDVEAAFAALQLEAPDVVARLGSSTSHEDAYAFLVDRCGVSVP